MQNAHDCVSYDHLESRIKEIGSNLESRTEKNLCSRFLPQVALLIWNLITLAGFVKSKLYNRYFKSTTPEDRLAKIINQRVLRYSSLLFDTVLYLPTTTQCMRCILHHQKQKHLLDDGTLERPINNK